MSLYLLFEVKKFRYFIRLKAARDLEQLLLSIKRPEKPNSSAFNTLQAVEQATLKVFIRSREHNERKGPQVSN